MTAAEWPTRGELEKILEGLHGKASNRKLRLLACAWCRDVWNAFTHRESREAVELAEKYSDGLVSPKEMSEARKRALAACKEQIMATATCRRSAWSAAVEAVHSLHSALNELVYPVPTMSDDPAEQDTWESAYYETAVQEHTRQQVQIIQDIFGSSIRVTTIDPTWLAWNYGTIPALARRIYEDRAFANLPILADALEDAGCTDATILDHCRSPGPHVRGCWVVDLLLGKQ